MGTRVGGGRIVGRAEQVRSDNQKVFLGVNGRRFGIVNIDVIPWQYVSYLQCDREVGVVVLNCVNTTVQAGDRGLRSRVFVDCKSLFIRGLFAQLITTEDGGFGTSFANMSIEPAEKSGRSRNRDNAQYATTGDSFPSAEVSHLGTGDCQFRGDVLRVSLRVTRRDSNAG